MSEADSEQEEEDEEVEEEPVCRQHKRVVSPQRASEPQKKLKTPGHKR